MIAAYLIPIISLWRPRTHLPALAAASDPDALPDALSFRERSVDYRTSPREQIARQDWRSPIPVKAWWSAWLVWLGAQVFADTFHRLRLGSLSLDLSMVSNAAAFVSLVCAGLVIRGVTLRQRECARRLVAGPMTDDDDEEEDEVEAAPRRQRRRSAQRRPR